MSLAHGETPIVADGIVLSFDPEDAKCPYCGEQGKPCSFIDSMARAYARGACKNKYKKNDNE